MSKPIVKYLDPISGEYEFATVVDIGDLRNLNTTIKSDIVGAINSIISGGVHNPIADARIEDLERLIDSLKDGTFKLEDFGSIDEYLKQQFLEELDRLNAQNKAEMEGVLTQLDTSVDDAIREYQEKVVAQNIILENAENTLADARDTLEAKAEELETAQIGLSELEHDFNELEGYISTNVRTIDFDNFNAMVEDYESVVTQASDEVGVDMSGSTLSYLTGRVTDAEANISVQADEITSKMGYDEFQYMPVPKYDYGENLLFDTFDFGDAWNGKNGAQVTPDTFLFGKVVAFNSPTGLYETRTDDLTIGESYVLSTYVNVQPSEKSPSQGRYEPISKSYDPTDFKIQIGGKSFNPGVYEDLSGINGWVRINQEFVADAVNPIISITPTGVNSQSEVAYMAMPKVEKGLTVTPWQPHIEDKYATMSSTQSMMKQQANSITAFVTEVSELDDSYKQATSTFQMLADGFAANTEAVEVFEDTVERYGTEYSNINGKFEQKVWKDDFEGIIEDINIDNRNRVLNSDFIRNEISSSDRRLIVEDWSLNSYWELKTIDDNKYLSRNRTGLTQNLITSASSNYFPVRDKERVLFGFDLIHSGLDNDKVFAIELFDISDKRLLKEEFSLSSLTKVGNRYHGSFNISTPGVQKGKVVLQLPKNGSVSFTKISFQNADIGSIDWSPAPEDSWIIQSKLETYISQVEDEITIGGVGRKMDTLTGLLTEDKGTFTLNPDKIATEVFNSETYDDMGFVNKTNFEQTADGWMQEITSEGRLAGYINATPDTYRISFDKIMLEGTTWADRLGSSKIMVTENFALIGKNGRPVLDVNNDGSINMNVTSLKVGPYNALTTGDKESITKDVTDSVIENTEPYIHIAYADTEGGAGLSFDPSGKEYIGLTKSSSPISSQTPSDYTWSKWTGKDGSNGIQGPKGDDGRTQYLHIAYANSADGTSGFSTDDSVDKLYIGTYTDFSEPDPTDPSKYNWTLIKGDKGERGATGSRGPQGYDGVGISSVTEHYLVSNQSTGVTYSTSGWGTSVPTMTPELRFLWNYEEIHFTDGTSEPTLPVVVGVYGQQGPKGSEGEDGRSIEKIEERYLATSIEAGVTRSTPGWTEKMQATTPTEKFLWNYEIITWTKAPLKTYVEPIIIGVHGPKGETGEQGPRGLRGLEGPEGKQGIEGKKGTNGKSSYTHIAYATGDQGQSFSHDTFSQATYIGMYVSDNQNSSDNWQDYKWTLIKGKDGARGLEGPKGNDGRTPYFHTAWANSANGQSGFSTTVSAGKFYLGTVTTFEPDDPTDYTKYSWTLIKGEKGDTGKDGVAGKDGVGLIGTNINYATSTSGTIRPNSWGDEVPTTQPGDYLWTKTTWYYSDNTSENGYSVSRIGKDGNTGKDGLAGKDGVGIKSTVIDYATSSSGTTKPTSGWNPTVPSVTPGNYLWTRTVWTYTDNDVETGYSVSRVGKDGKQGPRGLTGAQGPQGDQGIKGADGKDGQSSYTHIAYADTITGSGFSHSDASKPFIGIYADDKPTSSDTASKYTWSKWHGEDGDDGVQGPKGVDGKPSYTHFAYANNATGTSGFSTSDSLNKTYLGIYTDNTKNDSKDPGKYNWTLIKGATGAQGPRGVQGLQGPQGKQGIKGDTGADGKSSYTHIAYATGDQGQSFNHSTFEQATYVGMYVSDNQNSSDNWRDYEWTLIKGRDGSQGVRGPQGPEGKTPYFHIAYANNSTGTSGFSINDSANKLYIGTYTDFEPDDSEDPSKYNWTLVKGTKGDKGDDGKGITDQAVTYQNHTNGTTAPTGSWSSSPSPVKGRYLWTRTITTYTEGNPVTTYAVAYNATDGQNGSEGTGINGTEIRYQQSTSGSSTPTGTWQTSIPAPTKGRYLWTRTVISYTDGTNSTSYSTSYYPTDGEKGEKGDTGPRGPQGPQGQQGVSITKVDVEYAQNTSETTAPTSGWSTNAPTWKNGQYIWSRTKTTYSSGNPTYSKPACITGQKGSVGSTGSTGATGRGISTIVEQFYLSNSKTTQTGGSWSTTMPTWSPGKYIWTRSLITYTTGTPATSTTEPLVSSEWEAINEIEVGGVNIVLEGWKRVSTSNYMVAEYFIDEDFITGQTYTVVFKGTKPSTQQFGLWQNRGDSGRGTFVEVEKDIWKLTFTSISTTIGDERRVRIYQPDSRTAGPATIEWFKVVKGNKTSNDWQENLNDSFSSGDNLLKNSNFYKTYTGNTFTVGGVSYNIYAEGWSGYNGGVSNATTNYHAHIDNTTFNFPVIEYNESNGNRGWKGINTSGLQNNTVALLKKDANYNFSADVYATGSGTKLFGGFYYFKVGGTQKSFHASQFWIGISQLNSWHRVNANLFLPSDADTSKDITFYIYGYGFSTNSILYISNVKLAEGNKISAWTQSPEDVQSQIDEKANQTDTEARLNDIASELLVKQQEIEAAATAGELDAFVKKYNQEQEAYAKEKKASEKALTSAQDAIDLITNKMDNMAETWEFFDEYIKFEKGSIVLGNETEGSHVRIHNDRISFHSNGYEVAAITQGRMTIEAGTFVEEIQISEFKFQKSSNRHLTVRYVG